MNLACPALLMGVLVFATPLQGLDTAGNEDWNPVTAAEIASTTPEVDRNADAEVLFWDVQIEDKLATFGLQTELWHYLRIKVFTERGVTAHGAVDLPCDAGTKIDDIAGRVIRPDGSTVSLRPDDIHVRTLLQVGRRRARVWSFVLPAVIPGAIIEYHWHETRRARLSAYERLEFQREIPVRRVTYRIRPLTVQGERFAIKTRVYNAPSIPVERDGNGNLTVTMSNVPAAVKEPFMPPPAEARPWLLFFYAEQERGALPVYGKQLYEAQLPKLKPSRLVREAAKTIVGGGDIGENALPKFYAYCQEIRNADAEASGLSRAEIEALDDDATPDETLRKRAGTSTAINRLFCGLARAAGFEARMAVAGDAADVFPSTQQTSRSFFTGSVVAIPSGSRWRFFDPGSRFVPCEMLDWRKEGSAILVPDAVRPEVVEPLPSRPESSWTTRSASFRLEEDGSVEGEVRITYHGHAAVGERVDHAGESYVERRKALERKIRSVVGPALLSDTRIDCPDDATKPCTYRFRMKVPGFAAVSGKRLVISPSVFQAGRPPVFPRPERKSPIVFPYAWSEYDTTVIVLPSRFGWEASEPPVRLSLGEGGRFSWDLVANARGDTLTLFRSWKTYSIVVQPSEYASLWQSYRRLHEVDNRVVTLPRRPPR